MADYAVVDPASGSVIKEYPTIGDADLDSAVARAHDLPVLVHTPHRDKKRGTLRSLALGAGIVSTVMVACSVLRLRRFSALSTAWRVTS